MASGDRSAKSNAVTQLQEQGGGRYRDEIVRYLKKRVPAGSVEDLTQETLLTAHTYVSKGNTLERPLAFLYKTASFVVSNSYRARKKAAATETVADVDALGLCSQAPSVERSVMSEQEFEAFCMAIGRLPKKCRQAFVLRKVYQYSYKEIAEHCGVSVYTVKNHVKKGHKLVQAYRERHGLEAS